MCVLVYTFTFSFLQFLRSRLMAGIISFPYNSVSDRSTAVIRSLRFHAGQFRRLVVRDPPYLEEREWLVKRKETSAAKVSAPETSREEETLLPESIGDGLSGEHGGSTDR